MQAFDQERSFRHILVLESRDWWESGKALFDPKRDVVLTYDLGLKRDVEQLGGQVFYVDHLVDNRVMEENNFLVYKFFREWHWDVDGKDIFEYRGVPFGFSFRIEIWNDLVFYARACLCLEILRELEFEALYVGTQLGLVESILHEMKLPFLPVPISNRKSCDTYYFPIHRWMDENVRYHQGIRGVKYRIRDMVTIAQGILMLWVDRLLGWRHDKPALFVQEYHPTRKLVRKLQQDSRVRLVLASFSKSRGWFRYIPVWGREKKYEAEADALMHNFRTRRCARLVLSNGVDVSQATYQIIDKRIAKRITEFIRTLDCVIRYLDKNPIKLEVLIANIGQVATLVDCVCKSRGISSYFIINGMLVRDSMDEAKYATVINSYSVSMKEHYFRGMENIVCLGDPRMDAYVQKGIHHRAVNRNFPTVTIGVSGHSNTDLNSYLAVEFEFMHDVLEALRIIKGREIPLRIVIKARANSYCGQYVKFTQEFFPGLVDEIVDNVPIGTVLEGTDFFISFYSQTLFEASCMGIPCLYYKNDKEIMNPPFDGNSELVTVGSVEDIVDAIVDFRSGHQRYDAFLDRKVMEKYIGPLDGGNLERNLNFIYDYLKQSKAEAGR